MRANLIFTLSVLVTCHAVSISRLSDDSSSNKELFPDWVPFKNKHGDELGEFKPVQKKNKVKKRLAPVENYYLRAVEEMSDDYYEKGGGEGDSEDYFEKKEWSDLNRPADTQNHTISPKTINHPDLSNIDGVVTTILKKSENPIVIEMNKIHEEKPEAPEETKNPPMFGADNTMVDVDIANKGENKRRKTNVDEPETDYDEIKDYARTTKDESDSEEKKAKILSGVDALKERHAEEQKTLFTKTTDYDRDFEDKVTSTKEKTNRYFSKKNKKVVPDYDEYEEKNVDVGEKYKMPSAIIKDTNTNERSQVFDTTTEPLTTTKVYKHVESGKLSVFRNPQLYMVYDDDDSTSTINKPTVTPKLPVQRNQTPSVNLPVKYSAKYTTKAISDNDDDRISLVPEDSKEGEPTMFFPKKKNKKKSKGKTTQSTNVETTPTTQDDLFRTKSYNEVFDTTAAETKNTDTTNGSEAETPSDNPTTSGGTETSAPDSISEATENNKTDKDDFHEEKGGGNEHHAETEGEHEEHGKKEYKAIHKDKKGSKGHHSEEDHLGKYDDHGGIDKEHKEVSGHHGRHHHEEHGKKVAQYDESGKHSKGHSTKGSHDIHKKEEYEKKVEFFEEDGESDDDEKDGGFKEDKKHSKGSSYASGDAKSGSYHHKNGESGHANKGSNSHQSAHHHASQGKQSHGKKGNLKHQKAARDLGKKWVYHHGYPAKTSNLVVIDRRGDRAFHGPYYYG